MSYSDAIETVTEEDNTDREDEMEIAVSESPSLHDDIQLVSYPDSDSECEACNYKQQPILDRDFDEETDLVLVTK